MREFKRASDNLLEVSEVLQERVADGDMHAQEINMKVIDILQQLAGVEAQAQLTWPG